jgi:predicted membrane channel-forming protein YqfA (hemolysin III family)
MSQFHRARKAGTKEETMKKIIITSTIIATILTIALVALHDAETALTMILTPILIGLIALLIGSIWNGVVEIKEEIERRQRAKRKQRKEVR